MASCLKTNKKLTNHSMRKTLVSILKNSGQPRNVICEITGHARESSLDDYDEINEIQRKELSHIISGYKKVQNQIRPNEVSNQTSANESSNQALAVQHQRAGHWLRFITSNKKAKFIRQWWASILVFCWLDFRDFQQVFRHSYSTAWQPSLLLAAPFYHRVILVASSISTPKTSVRIENHARNEGLT